MIEKVSIQPWCIACKNCETVCPSIFKVKKASQVISHHYGEAWQDILKAQAMCPVQVIDVKQDGTLTLDYKEAQVIDKKYLTPDTLELSLSVENFTFLPGQYVSLQMKDWRWEFARSYSIAHANKNSLTLTIKLLENGRGAEFLKKLKKNRKIEYLGPSGNFVLQDTNKPKVFIATGTGLAPMIAMLEQTPKEVQKMVIFGVRNSEDVYYQEVLESFPNTEVVITVSRPSDAWRGNTWRVTNYLEAIPRESEIYICGNPDMVEFVTDYLREEWHADTDVYYEEFTISPWYHKSVWKEILLNGTLPGVHILSRGVIIWSLFILPVLLYFQPWLQWLFWLISWYAVSFVMMIRPLADLFPKIWLLRKLVTLRKAFWILSASIVVTSFIFTYLWEVSLSRLFTLDAWALENRSFFARLSEITAFILLLTSNHFSQRKLWVWWKKIQNTAYIYFFSGWLVAVQYGHEWLYYGSMWLVIILWLAAHFDIKIYK